MPCKPRHEQQQQEQPDTHTHTRSFSPSPPIPSFFSPPPHPRHQVARAQAVVDLAGDEQGLELGGDAGGPVGDRQVADAEDEHHREKKTRNEKKKKNHSPFFGSGGGGAPSSADPHAAPPFPPLSGTTNPPILTLPFNQPQPEPCPPHEPGGRIPSWGGKHTRGSPPGVDARESDTEPPAATKQAPARMGPGPEPPAHAHFCAAKDLVRPGRR